MMLWRPEPLARGGPESIGAAGVIRRTSAWGRKRKADAFLGTKTYSSHSAVNDDLDSIFEVCADHGLPTPALQSRQDISCKHDLMLFLNVG